MQLRFTPSKSQNFRVVRANKTTYHLKFIVDFCHDVIAKHGSDGRTLEPSDQLHLFARLQQVMSLQQGRFCLFFLATVVWQASVLGNVAWCQTMHREKSCWRWFPHALRGSTEGGLALLNISQQFPSGCAGPVLASCRERVTNGPRSLVLFLTEQNCLVI